MLVKHDASGPIGIMATHSPWYLRGLAGELGGEAREDTHQTVVTIGGTGRHIGNNGSRSSDQETIVGVIRVHTRKYDLGYRAISKLRTKH